MNCSVLTAIALASLFLLFLCPAEANAAVGVDEVVELSHGTLVTENIFADEIIIPHGVEVRVEGDVELSASRSIVIFGSLIVNDASHFGGDGASILTLASEDILTVHGVVVGGRGICYRNIPKHLSGGMKGGDGTTINLSAPDILVTGLVTGGDGGHGGPGADGGEGGWVIQTGRHITDRHVAPVIAPPLDSVGVARRGGDGGDGGDGFGEFRNGGNGANSGGVHCELHANDFSRSEWAFSSLTTCTKGVDGNQTPGENVGGAAGNGGDGLNGTEDAPNGGASGSGGNSAPVTGADAQDGGDATDCCNPPSFGKNGGKGGKSSDCTTQNGGNNGKAGNGYQVGGQGPYLGTGGNAGNAGSSGSAFLKPGGKGGNGGDGAPPGSAGVPGAAGKATIGKAGTLNPPGMGTTNGSAGTGGGTGSINGGGTGALGTSGDPCNS